MGRTLRTMFAAGCGFAAGMAIGPASVLMANVSDTLMRGWAWPDLDAEYVRSVLFWSLPAGVNGAIGAATAAGFGTRRRLPVTLLPAGLHVAAAVGALAVDAREFLLWQLFALVLSAVIWPAGRVGQMIGWALRCRTPRPAAEAAP